MKKHFGIFTTFLVFAACSSVDVQNDFEPTSITTQMAEMSDAANTNVSNGVELTFMPESLQIKEICIGVDQCVYRQRCGKSKSVLKNNLDNNIHITKVILQKQTHGETIQRKRVLDFSDSNLTIPAHKDAKLYSKKNCECRDDRYCTPDFPHMTSPFLIGLSEKITVYYTTTDDTEHMIEAISPYVLVRQAL